MTHTTRIGFLGIGNMSSSIIKGLLQNGTPAACIHAFDIATERCQWAREQLGIHLHDSAAELSSQCDVLCLAVKPQQLADACASLQIQEDHAPLLISIAAGVRINQLSSWLFDRARIIRIMPNTPALVSAGASALFANAHCHESDRTNAESLIRAVGLSIWLEDENQLDAVTALSGSGPAYFFYIMELMDSIGQQLGLTAEQSRLLTLQTAFGAAKLALESDDDPATLRRKVTSPGGTTECALKHLQAGPMAEIFKTALNAARDRAREMAG